MQFSLLDLFLSVRLDLPHHFVTWCIWNSEVEHHVWIYISQSDLYYVLIRCQELKGTLFTLKTQSTRNPTYPSFPFLLTLLQKMKIQKVWSLWLLNLVMWIRLWLQTKEPKKLFHIVAGLVILDLFLWGREAFLELYEDWFHPYFPGVVIWLLLQSM